MIGLWGMLAVGIMALAGAPAGAGGSPGLEGFHTSCSIDWRNPIPVAWLRKARIDTVFIYIGQPVVWNDPTGQPALGPKTDPQLIACLEHYRGSGIKVLVLGNYYCHVPPEAAAVDASGRRLALACLRQPAFAQWLRRTLTGQAEVFSRFEAFGGFCFDDASGVRCDACYCPLCVKTFQTQTGRKPPAFQPAEGGARLAPDDTRLLWDAFQRQAYDDYIRLQAETVRRVLPDCLMVTIPADSYYYGRYLNQEVPQPDTVPTLAARLQRLTRFRNTHWAIFQAFPFPRLPEAGETGFQPWAIGAHICQPSTGLIQPQEGPQRTVGSTTQGFFSPEEIRRLVRVTVAEGAPGIAYWAWPAVLIAYPEAFDALAEAHEDLARLGPLLAERRPLPADVGLLHSTTTEVLEQPWRRNTLERWRHLHAWEAVAYALHRAHVPHRIVQEPELDDRTLDSLRVLILAGVRFLTEPCARRLEDRMAAGRLTVLTDPQSLPLTGAVVVPCDPYRWYGKLLAGYRQPRHLDAQQRHLAQTLVPAVIRHSGRQPLVESDDVLSFAYRDRQGRLVLFLANWKLEEPAEATVQGVRPPEIVDLLPGSGGLTAVAQGTRLTVPPAGWRVIRVEGPAPARDGKAPAGPTSGRTPPDGP